MPDRSSSGRPRKYCRRSHRQRHYEARRLAATKGLAPDHVLISRATLHEWRDLVYTLASVIEDVEQDLEVSSTLKDYTEAFVHLHETASAVSRFGVEPLAVADEPR